MHEAAPIMLIIALLLCAAGRALAEFVPNDARALVKSRATGVQAWQAPAAHVRCSRSRRSPRQCWRSQPSCIRRRIDRIAGVAFTGFGAKLMLQR